MQKKKQRINAINNEANYLRVSSKAIIKWADVEKVQYCYRNIGKYRESN